MGDEGKTPADWRWRGSKGVSGGDGESRDWRRMDGRNLLSRRRRGGVRGGRVVVGEGMRGWVGEPRGGKSWG